MTSFRPSWSLHVGRGGKLMLPNFILSSYTVFPRLRCGILASILALYRVLENHPETVYRLSITAPGFDWLNGVLAYVIYDWLNIILAVG